MKYHNKSILLFIMFFIFLIMSVGCTSNIPTIPGINPNPPVNPENSTVSYIEVTAPSSTINVNQSLQLTVRGYNSEDEWVIMDKSKIKLWKWTVIGGLCSECVKPHIDLSPQSGSLTTIFASGITGTFFICAYYQENVGDDYITKDKEIVVN